VDSQQIWSRRRSVTFLAAHVPLSLAGPVLLALTRQNHASGCELLCNQTAAEILALSAIFWVPATLLTGLVAGIAANLLFHGRVQVSGWRTSEACAC
jgi:hypothetical protein